MTSIIPLPAAPDQAQTHRPERGTVERRIRAARFPAVKSFGRHPRPQKDACPGTGALWLHPAPGGTGKTHIVLALGLAARQNGFSVSLAIATSLVKQLLEWRAACHRRRCV